LGNEFLTDLAHFFGLTFRRASNLHSVKLPYWGLIPYQPEIER
jgi:hypothetical protein